MAIGSIDLQVLIPRATDASKAQQLSDHQPTLQQQQLAEQQQNLDIRQQKQVQNTVKTSGKKVDNKAQRENHHNNNETEEEETSDDGDNTAGSDASAPIDPSRGHLIDIKT